MCRMSRCTLYKALFWAECKNSLLAYYSHWFNDFRDTRCQYSTNSTAFFLLDKLPAVNLTWQVCELGRLEEHWSSGCLTNVHTSWYISIHVLTVETTFNMALGSVCVINRWHYSQFRTAVLLPMMRIAVKSARSSLGILCWNVNLFRNPVIAWSLVWWQSVFVALFLLCLFRCWV